MRTDILATVEQLDPTILGEGGEEVLRQSKLGQLFTAGWRERLLLAGKVWKAHLGTLTDANDMTKIVGGGNGTILDLDEPEIVVAVDAGYFLIPLEIDIEVTSDIDTPDDYETILAYADRTQATAAGATATATVPVNLLDGAGAFPGRCFTAVTAAITDPVVSELLAYKRKMGTAVVMAGTAANEDDILDNALHLHYEPSIPSILAGACQFCVHFGGTVATSGAGFVVFACVPSSWFPVT